jgi:hypothetical protein
VADKPLNDVPPERAAVARHACYSLVASIEEMRRNLGLDRDSAKILDEIKKTMHVEVPPHGFTVLQVLAERECGNAFNQLAADEFPTVRQEFEHAIRDFMGAREARRVPARRIHKVARNAWKQDPGADRRTRAMEQGPPDEFRSPYRGRPELYDPGVVSAFEIAIARAIGRSHVSWTRGTIDSKSSGPILDVLVAAVQWAMCIAWQFWAPPGAAPPNVKAEGLLGIVKAKREKSTD